LHNTNQFARKLKKKTKTKTLVTIDIQLLPSLVAVRELIQDMSQILMSKDITLIIIDSSLG